MRQRDPSRSPASRCGARSRITFARNEGLPSQFLEAAFQRHLYQPGPSKTNRCRSAVKYAHPVEPSRPGSNGWPAKTNLLFNPASELDLTQARQPPPQKPFSTANEPNLVLATPNITEPLGVSRTEPSLETFYSKSTAIPSAGTGRASPRRQSTQSDERS